MTKVFSGVKKTVRNLACENEVNWALLINLITFCYMDIIINYPAPWISGVNSTVLIQSVATYI